MGVIPVPQADMYYNVMEVPAGTRKGAVALQLAFVESDFEVERIISASFHFIGGGHFGSYGFP